MGEGELLVIVRLVDVSGVGDTWCSGVIRRDTKENADRRESPVRVLTLMHESVGSKKG